MAWVEAALWWVPTAAVVVMTVLALLAALAQAPRAAKAGWIVAVLAFGATAIAVSVWQQESNRAALAEEAERLHGVSSQLTELGRLLPAPPGGRREGSYDTVANAIVALNDRIKDLEQQIQALREKARARTIDGGTAAKMADYLRPFGSRRVVVSCIPDDVEAFNYANQIANVLRAAGWDAPGPETTKIFGEARATAVTLYVRAGSVPETAKVLLDAFTRFNIPYKSGVMPSDAIPDPAMVELFVGPKA